MHYTGFEVVEFTIYILCSTAPLTQHPDWFPLVWVEDDQLPILSNWGNLVTTACQGCASSSACRKKENVLYYYVHENTDKQGQGNEFVYFKKLYICFHVSALFT